MGERKGQNKYYPPDFDWKVHKSLNAYHGTHALRERARKLDQGILIIRFEMPFNIWCNKCGNHIGMGVRYNAEKTKVGMYYSTPLWKFRMKCHLCDNHFEISTDPKNMTYVIDSGARREELRWDAKENEQIVPESFNEKRLLATDAMYKLAHQVSDQEAARKVLPSLTELERVQNCWKDDYKLNSLIRAKFRTEKANYASTELPSFNIPLLPEEDKDKVYASLLASSCVKTKSPVTSIHNIENEAAERKRQASLDSISNSAQRIKKTVVPKSQFDFNGRKNLRLDAECVRSECGNEQIQNENKMPVGINCETSEPDNECNNDSISTASKSNEFDDKNTGTRSLVAYDSTDDSSIGENN